MKTTRPDLNRAAALLALGLALLPPLQSHAQATPELQQGVATHDDATGPVSCAFDLDPRERLIAAMNAVQYGQADWCGASVRVDGPKGSVVVRIVNRCPECPAGHLDLSREAFAQIADLVTGIVPIRWQLVSPALSGPIAYHFKHDSDLKLNPYWLAVQVRNHRNPLVRLEYDAGGQWVEVPRKDHNYFEMTLPKQGPGHYRFSVTDLFGHQLVDEGIPFKANATVKGRAQFPRRPERRPAAPAARPAPPGLRPASARRTMRAMTNDDDLSPLPTIRTGRYRHYKGGEYQVLGVVRHSESLEPMVLYRPLGRDVGDWVRPFTMFLETVEHQGQRVLRFSPVGDDAA